MLIFNPTQPMDEIAGTLIDFMNRGIGNNSIPMLTCIPLVVHLEGNGSEARSVTYPDEAAELITNIFNTNRYAGAHAVVTWMGYGMHIFITEKDEIELPAVYVQESVGDC